MDQALEHLVPAVPPFRPKTSKTTPCTVAKWLPARVFSVIPKNNLTRRANQGYIYIIPPFARRPSPCAAAGRSARSLAWRSARWLYWNQHSADVIADAAATAFEVPLGEFERFRKAHPHASEQIMRNLAQLLADRLILANAKVNLLTSN